MVHNLFFGGMWEYKNLPKWVRDLAAPYLFGTFLYSAHNTSLQIMNHCLLCNLIFFFTFRLGLVSLSFSVSKGYRKEKEFALMGMGFGGPILIGQILLLFYITYLQNMALFKSYSWFFAPQTFMHIGHAMQTWPE